MPVAFGMPGYQEMIVIMIVGLLVFGRRLPEVGRTLGKTVVQLRKGIADFREQIRHDEDLRDVKATVHDFKRAVDAPRAFGDPRRMLENLADEAPATPDPPAETAGEDGEGKPGERSRG
jgi:sec-independent protein translocase protein TatA